MLSARTSSAKVLSRACIRTCKFGFTGFPADSDPSESSRVDTAASLAQTSVRNSRFVFGPALQSPARTLDPSFVVVMRRIFAQGSGTSTVLWIDTILTRPEGEPQPNARYIESASICNVAPLAASAGGGIEIRPASIAFCTLPVVLALL